MAETVLRQFGNSQGTGRGPIWIIDADHWPRAYLRAELLERGYDVVGFVTVGDALARLALRFGSPPALVAIDLQGQSPVELAPLLRGRYPVLAIGGATEWARESPPSGSWAAFLRRPLTIGAIVDEIDRLLAHRPTSAE